MAMVDLITPPPFKPLPVEYVTGLVDFYERRPAKHGHTVHDIIFRNTDGKLHEINIAIRAADPFDVAASLGRAPNHMGWETTNG